MFVITTNYAIDASEVLSFRRQGEQVEVHCRSGMIFKVSGADAAELWQKLPQINQASQNKPKR